LDYDETCEKLVKIRKICMIQIRAVFYDFDGPISDSFDSGMSSLLRMCKNRGIKITEKQRMKMIEMWGLSARLMIRKVFNLSDIQANSLYSAWEGMEKENPHDITLGAPETLAHTQSSMVNVLFTSRGKRYIEKELLRMRLSHRFDLKFTSDDLDVLKPNPLAFKSPLNLLKREFGIRPEECLFVGDTWTDAACGAGARIKTLIMLNGPYRYSYHANKCFVGTENTLESIADLPNWLSSRNPILIHPGL